MRRSLDLKALAAKARGLAPAALSAKMQPGAVFLAKNEAVSFPEARLPHAGEPTEHVVRWVIVVQSIILNTAANPKTILVVPCSASQRTVGQWDYELPPNEEGFTAPRVVALASLVQPFLKSDLERYLGRLRDTTLLDLQRILLRNMGLYQERMSELPPREGSVVRQATDAGQA